MPKGTRTNPPEGFVPPTGFCECGCGERTPISRNSKPERGQYFGHPLRFIRGHNSLGTHPARAFGEKSANWKGGTALTRDGYRLIYMPGHALADRRNYVLEHRFVWHEANGPIPDGHHVHHIDGNRLNNEIANLACIAPTDHGRHHGRNQSADKRARISAALKRAWKKRRH